MPDGIGETPKQAGELTLFGAVEGLETEVAFLEKALFGDMPKEENKPEPVATDKITQARNRIVKAVATLKGCTKRVSIVG